MFSSFDLDKLKEMLHDFYVLTKIRITVFDEDFHELAAWPEKMTPICRCIRCDPQADAACRASNDAACRTAAGRKSPYTYRCHAGLTESIVPIRLSNIVVGYLFFGQVFSYATRELGWKEVRKCCAKYAVSSTELKKACLASPLTGEDFITTSSHIMQAVASYLCLDRIIVLRQEDLPVRIDRYIQEHFTEELDPGKITAEFGIGRTRLYKIASENYGTGIAEHIRDLRIKEAQTLLADRSDLTVAEISGLCGFPDYNYFCTVFRKATGLPPGRYRRTMS
ncbi:MAG: PocR ligand-binding domain-containing protein [Lachnospiraceae bacterium]|jgi:AraC-like DNA-binding protein|nr:PocR ligand-binding domain-containing protein [Lachnospiraceae bacterium]